LSTPTTPWYTDQEIDDLCAGLTHNAAKMRYLRAQGLTVTQKPNGRPLLMREHATKVLSGMPSTETPTENATRQALQPNRAGLVMQLASRRG